MIFNNTINLLTFISVIACGFFCCKANETDFSSLIPDNYSISLTQKNISALELATQLLWDAVERNDPVGARDAIGMGANTGYRNDIGCTPLHRAATLEHLEVASVLLKAGVDKEALDVDGDRPLHGAAYLGKNAAVALLAVAGADMNSRGHQGMTALLQATTSGKNSTVDLIRTLSFLQSSIPLTQMKRSRVFDEEATTEMMAAYKVKDLKKFRAAIEKGADPDKRDSEHYVLLHRAAEDGGMEMAEILLESGAAVNPRSKSGNTPLHYAAINGRDGIVILLVKAGADITAPGYNGLTPLQKAESNGKSATAALLKALGAKH